MSDMEVQAVAVLGAGTMGHGIAHVSAAAGMQVRLFDVREEAAQAGFRKIQANLDKGVEKGKIQAADRDATLSRIRCTADLAAAVGGAQLVVEAIPEILDLKRALFAQIAPFLDEAAILATNTSSIQVARIAEAAPRPEQVLGLHFFNPVHLMALLEIVVHPGTRPEVLTAAQAYGQRIGKECITVRDLPGFATSRLGVALGMEAIRMVQDGVASPEDIDKAMVLGYRHPVGPLRLTDMVGLDVRMNIGEYLAKALNNPAFEPPALMREMVARGEVGQKAGRGFYRW